MFCYELHCKKADHRGGEQTAMTFEERIAKLFREFPTEVYEPDELAIVVIKSHLLAEHYLDVIAVRL
jgi:hypothetical protein